MSDELVSRSQSCIDVDVETDEQCEFEFENEQERIEYLKNHQAMMEQMHAQNEHEHENENVNMDCEQQHQHHEKSEHKHHNNVEPGSDVNASIRDRDPNKMVAVVCPSVSVSNEGNVAVKLDVFDRYVPHLGQTKQQSNNKPTDTSTQMQLNQPPEDDEQPSSDDDMDETNGKPLTLTGNLEKDRGRKYK
jgi:hypothetical protein